jgi:hypothetical protein
VRLKLVVRLNFASRGWGSYKGLKSPLPLSSLMTTCMLPIAPSHAHLGRGERREREREIGTLMLF